ncbi:MAG TPA: rod-binding protein [Acetivibrio sp.]|jgi:flagellar protein FlgJ|nr:flagellar biosynthesis protein FlgJ [Clostridium sp.]HOQ37458.1 rod-binding protein [Acetivibrio sp.]HPT91414.1 rod-binding protein [Acetivibrio sp.]HQA56624.1 rod-binding protein [Acetivibrio sp.]
MNISGIGSESLINVVKSTEAKVSGDSFEERLQNAFENKDEKELMKACKEFEGMLLSIVYKQMKATIPKSNLIPSDYGRDIFEEMLDEEIAKEASQGSGLGLADELYKQLSRSLKKT